MEEKNTFGKFIMAKRKEAGLTQHELAERLYITESAISKWERGLSYPDITLILPICKELNISEHELITSSEDHTQRTIEHQANNYKKIYKTYNGIFLSMYACAIIACFICNIAIFHELTWFFVVLTGIMTGGSLITLPTLLHKNKAVITLASFYISLNLLLVTCAILYGGGAWIAVTEISVLFGMCIIFLPFILRLIPAELVISRHKAAICLLADTALLYATVFAAVTFEGNYVSCLPRIAILILFELILPYVYLAVIRYTKLNGMFKCGICIAVTGVVYFFENPMISYMIDDNYRYDPVDFTKWDIEYSNGNVGVIVVITCMVLAFIFTIAGIMKQYREQTSK